MPAGTPVEQTAAVLRELGAYLATRARGHRLPGLCRHRRADQLQRPGAPVLPAQPAARSATSRSTWSTSTTAAHRATPSPRACVRRCRRSASASAPTSRWSKCRRARRCCRRIVAEVYGPDADGRRAGGQGGARGLREAPPDIVDVDDSSIADAPQDRAAGRPAQGGAAGRAAAGDRDARCAPAWPARPRPTCTMQSQVPGRRDACSCRPSAQGDLDALLQLTVRAPTASWCRSANWSTRERHAARAAASITRTCCRWSTSSADMAGKLDSPLYGMFDMRGESWQIATPGGGTLAEYFIQPARRSLPRLCDQVGRRVADHLRDLPRHGRRLRGRAWS